jgi:capsular polysaccharide biosynthesis protein
MAQRVESGKVNAAAAGRGGAAISHQHWTDGETMSTFQSQPPSGNAVGRLLRFTWRYKLLIAAAVLLGALLGYGWAARQPTLYQGVARVLLVAGSDRTALPGESPYPPGDPESYLRSQAQLMRSSPVLERAVTLTGSRISVETLGERLEVEVASDADVLTIRVVDSTVRGAAQLTDAVTAAYQEVVANQLRDRSREVVRQLRDTRSRLQARSAEINAELGRDPADPVLRAQRRATAEQLSVVQSRLLQVEAMANRIRPSLVRERAAVPNQPITPGPGRAIVIGMLLGLLASAVLVWWRSRGQGPPSGASASEQGPELPSPA